jgi:uncharacterized repeat protein (TIGR01451 family)
MQELSAARTAACYLLAGSRMNTVAAIDPITAKVKVAVWCVLLLTFPASLAQAGTPSPGTVPGAPERVIAVALPEAAIVAWLLPESFSNAPPITSYTISGFDTEAAQSVAVTAKARRAGAVVHGLKVGHCYSFRVHANNATGNSPESEPSDPICLAALGADIALTMTAPASASPGSPLAFTMTVTNNGTSDAALVSVVDTLPAPLASFTTSQGVCQGATGGVNFGCSLGALRSSASATVTVTVMMGNTDISNTAWASAYNDAGATLPDPLPGNNAGNVTVRVQPTVQDKTAALP